MEKGIYYGGGKVKKPISFRMTNEQKAFLDRYGQDKSMQLREDMDTLHNLIARGETALAGRFAVGEACLICDVLNGTIYEPRFADSLASILATEVSDGIMLNNFAEKWEVDSGAIKDKIKGLTSIEAYIVWHWARTFWSRPYKDEDLREAVKILFKC